MTTIRPFRRAIALVHRVSDRGGDPLGLAAPGAACGGERRTLVAGSLVYLLGTGGLRPARQPGSLLSVDAGLRRRDVHAAQRAFGLLNHLETERKGLVNGLYVSAYYAGAGARFVSSGFLYQQIGWNAFIALLLTCCCAHWSRSSLMLRHAPANRAKEIRCGVTARTATD